MTDDYNQNENATELAQREQEMVQEGKDRFEKRLAKKTLDQTRAGVEILSLNVDGIEEGLKFHLRYRAEGKGGKKAFWEQWLQRMDVNWKTSQRDAAGKPIFNPIDEQNLFPIASLAGRVAMEGYSKKQTLAKLCMRLGEAFEGQVWATVLSETDDGRAFVRSMDRVTQRISNDPMTRQERALYIAKKQGYDPVEFAESEILRCGVILWNSVLYGGGIFANKRLREEDDNWKTYYPVLIPEVEEAIAERNAELASMEPRFQPIHEKPRPWGKDSFGPYRSQDLNKMLKMVKNMHGKQIGAVDDAIISGQLDLPTEALTALQSVPYLVNQYVLRAVDWVRQDADRAQKVNGFPRLKRLDLEKLDHVEIAKKTKFERRAIYAERREEEADNNEADTNKTKIDGWIKEATKQGDKKFYLPHQFDRRGRVYHVPEFGHHNTDALRALFYLGNKKPIGDQFHWISVALANNYGVDKRSLDDRQAWAEANQEVIAAAGRTFANEKDEYDVRGYVDDELVNIGRMTPFDFWRQADEPMQFLAACHEYAEIMDFEERNPGRGDEFMSGLPIALDAAQSGIQHFASASLNYNDGLLTNLVPQDAPNDFYNACLSRAKVLLQEKLDRDRAALAADPLTEDDWGKIDDFNTFINDDTKTYQEVKRRRRAFKLTDTARRKKLHDHIDVIERTLAYSGYTRSFIKRNGMTFGYSSRAPGFAEQLMEDVMKPLSQDLRQGLIDEHPFGADGGFTAAHVLAQIHEQAIRGTVESASVGMDFLQSCSDALHNENKHFEFINKWGFPVFQNYEGTTKSGNRPKLLWYDFNLLDVEDSESAEHQLNPMPTLKRDQQTLKLQQFNGQVDYRASRQGIAPNVIHSQDALMLQMAVLLCQEDDINDIIVVHDSFATTIADVAEMRRRVLLAMVDLYHDYDLWQDIYDQVVARLDNPESVAMIKPMPDRSVGKLNIEDILKSNYAIA